MTARDLQAARQALRWGVGQTSLKQRALPGQIDLAPIPARMGDAASKENRQAAPDMARGFVAAAHAATVGVRFDPATLAVLEPGYTLVGAPYEVQAFSSGFHVDDSTRWADVVEFAKNKIRVNAFEMILLDQPSAVLSAPAFPHLIPGAAGEEYGTPQLNATQKRVFAVARTQVQTWCGGGSESVLTPTAPRTDNKAMTIGPRVVSALHRAYLGQIWYTGMAWDDNQGAWAFSDAAITMALAGNFLTKISSTPTIALAAPSFGAPATSSGSETTPVTLPSTPIFLTGRGEVYTYGNPTVNGYYNGAIIIWPWSGTVSKALAGERYKSFSRTTYSSSGSSSVSVAGRTLTYTASNVKTFDAGSDQYSIPPQTIVIAPGAINPTGDILIGPDLQWISGNSPGYYASRPKGRESWTNAYASTIAGSTATKTWEDQTGSFSVKLGTDTLVALTFGRHKSAGQEATLAPNSGYYNQQLANPYANVWDSSGWGLGAHAQLYEAESAVNQPPEAVHQKMVEMADAFAAMTYYQSEEANGISSRTYYTATLDSGYHLDDRTLAWSTKDYLLYDEINGVFITIEGAFSGQQNYGSQATATLTVILKIATRYHVTSQTLWQANYTYTQLLPESVQLAAEQAAIPSPRLMAIWSPGWQEQGSFKGAAYVTAAEETLGAAPAHLFNFRLALHMFDSLSAVDAANRDTAEVHFVPIYLLEMLYGTIFSQEFGRGSTRYPVTFPQRYAAIRDGLFTTPVAVAVRNGVSGAWTGGMRPDLAATANLTRT